MRFPISFGTIHVSTFGYALHVTGKKGSSSTDLPFRGKNFDFPIYQYFVNFARACVNHKTLTAEFPIVGKIGVSLKI